VNVATSMYDEPCSVSVCVW